MDIERIGRNPAVGNQQRSRASQISVHNGTVYFAATPDRPFDPGASVGEQTRQMLARVEERAFTQTSDTEDPLDSAKMTLRASQTSIQRKTQSTNSHGRKAAPNRVAKSSRMKSE